MDKTDAIDHAAMQGLTAAASRNSLRTSRSLRNFDYSSCSDSPDDLIDLILLLPGSPGLLCLSMLLKQGMSPSGIVSDDHLILPRRVAHGPIGKLTWCDAKSSELMISSDCWILSRGIVTVKVLTLNQAPITF